MRNQESFLVLFFKKERLASACLQEKSFSMLPGIITTIAEIDLFGEAGIYKQMRRISYEYVMKRSRGGLATYSDFSEFATTTATVRARIGAGSSERGMVGGGGVAGGSGEGGGAAGLGRASRSSGGVATPSMRHSGRRTRPVSGWAETSAIISGSVSKCVN